MLYPLRHTKAACLFIKTSGFEHSDRCYTNNPLEQSGIHSDPILLLILIWARFAKAIFFTLEEGSLPLTHIEDSGRNGLHGLSPFYKVVVLAF
jgi:hypothetical protein